MPNATVAMPRPGKEPLKRLKRVKGPVYRHCSLGTNQYDVRRFVGMKSVLSCPWVAFCPVGGGCGELPGVEAGDGGARCHCDGSEGSAPLYS